MLASQCALDKWRAAPCEPPYTSRRSQLSSRYTTLGIRHSAGKTYRHPRPPCSRVNALAGTAAANSQPDCAQQPAATQERVLRYPDGKERRILYPVVDEKESCEEFCDTCFDETWEVDHPWDIPAAGAYHSAGLGVATRKQETNSNRASTKPVTGKVTELPSSPAELLRYLTSDDYKRAQQETWDRVRSSYKVLQGCPWVLPRPLYVLAAAQRGSDAGETYTLRTRVSRKEEEDELTKLLRRTRPDGSAVVRVEQLVDGVVAFANDRSAARFAELLEGDGYDAVSVMEVDSHQLFRTVVDVKACVVLLPREGAEPADSSDTGDSSSSGGGEVPQPEMLAAVLRGQRPADDL